MTISKKLFLMATLAIGMNTLPYYDAVQLDTKVTTILNFAQTLQQPTAANRQVTRWLEKGLANKDYSSSFSNDDVISISRIVEINSTTEAKVAGLLTIIANKKAAALKNAKRDAKNDKRERKYTEKRRKEALKEALEIGFGMGALAAVGAYIIAQNIILK